MVNETPKSVRISSSEDVGNLTRRAIARSVGLDDDKLSRPLVGVIHGWNEMSIGDFHLPKLAAAAKQAVSEAGGTPIEFVVPGLCAEMKGANHVRRYFFAYRDFAAGFGEILVNFHQLAGVIFFATCDNQIPAFLMAAARTNVPAIVVTGGFASPGYAEGQVVTAFDVPKFAGKYVAGDIGAEQLENVIQNACSCPGGCPEMGTASTMACVAEALGMTLPGNAQLHSASTQLRELASRAGAQVMQLIGQDLRPRQIITRRSLTTAMRTVLAVGGSPNAIIHIAAIAAECGIEVGLNDWDVLSRSTPFICSISPNRPGYTMLDFSMAGGMPAVLGEMSALVDMDALTVTGRSLAENVGGAASIDHNIIRPLDNPFAPEGGIAILRGNIAPDGAIVKTGVLPPGLQQFRGPARVFEDEETATGAALAGRIVAGDVVVVRNEGPRGGAGSREVVNLLHGLVGMGLSDTVAVVTDGRSSGGNRGLAVTAVSPESYAGGPIGLVRAGDPISIDIPGRSLQLEVSEQILADRRDSARREVVDKTAGRDAAITNGVLGLYSRAAEGFHRGARLTAMDLQQSERRY